MREGNDDKRKIKEVKGKGGKNAKKQKGQGREENRKEEMKRGEGKKG